MGTNTVYVKRDIRAEPLQAASEFRQRMAIQGTYVVRLLSSPGAGKTALVEATAAELGKRYRVGILVGDIETERDAERLLPYAPTIQITTGGACHLEIPLAENAYARFGVRIFDFLFIEDVGNLVCPASHDLGEHLRVVLLSTIRAMKSVSRRRGETPHSFAVDTGLNDSRRFTFCAVANTISDTLPNSCSSLYVMHDARGYAWKG